MDSPRHSFVWERPSRAWKGHVVIGQLDESVTFAGRFPRSILETVHACTSTHRQSKVVLHDFVTHSYLTVIQP